MTELKQTSPVEILIKVISVKMKIKFSCKMALQYNKQIATKEVSSGQANKFIFNEDITLNEQQNSQGYQILTNLCTSKGTRYTAGVMKLLRVQLIRSQGQKLVIPLTKCLDPDAFCEINVQQVTTVAKSPLNASKSNSKIVNNGDRMEVFSPDIKKISNDQYLTAETKSETNFQMISVIHNSQEGRHRKETKTQIFKTFTKSPTNKYSNIKHLAMNSPDNFKGVKNMSDFPVQDMNSQRPTFAETEVIRDGYQKLKEKYKKEAQLAKEQTHKRMLLEANQNNYKLEIMKLKLKCEAQEKELNEKNDKIKAINAQLIDIQKKDIDHAYLKEQYSALQTKIQLYQDTIHTLTRDNESIKKLMAEKYKIQKETISGLKYELQFAMTKIEEHKNELDLQIKAKDAIILSKNNDLKNRAQTIDRQKKLVKQLQDQAEAKLFQFQRSLSAERNIFQTKTNELKRQIVTITQEKQELKNKNLCLLQQIQKQKNLFSVFQYKKKFLSEEVVVLNKEIEQLKLLKGKYSELNKEHILLEDQFAVMRKNLQLSLQNKQLNINQLISKYQEGKKLHQKSKGQYQGRVKSLLLKAHELEMTIETTKNALERSLRSGEHLSKEIATLKNENVAMKGSLKVAEKRLYILEGNLSTSNVTFLIEKYRDEKQSLEKQNSTLKEKNEKLEEIKISFQRKEQEWKLKGRHFEEKAEKQSSKYKQTLSKYQFLIKDHEGTIAQLGSNIQQLTNQQKNLRKKKNQHDLAEIKAKQKEQRLRKEIKLNQQKISSFELQLKSKIQQMLSHLQKNRYLQFTLNEKELEISKLKQQILQGHNKTAKQLQINELVKEDIIKLNTLISELQTTITIKYQSQENLRHQIKSAKQDCAKQKIRGNKIQNDFDKFKEAINDIIRIEFTKILKTPSSTQKNTDTLKESQISHAKSQKSKNKISLDASQLISLLLQKLHSTKNSLWKMVELNKAFKAENVQLLEQSQSQSNKHQFAKLELHRGIQQLQDEMNNLINDKEVEQKNYDSLVIGLNAKIKQKQLILENMKGQIDQYNAIITGMKTDFETNNDLNDKRVKTLKNTIKELNQRIEYLTLNVACLEDKNHQLQEKTIELDNQIIAHKQLFIKHERIILNTKEHQEKLIKDMQLLKNSYKSLQQTHNELAIQINTEKETKQKYVIMLQQQENKSQKLNEFNTNLIIQKEKAIKNQLQRSEEVNTLQNKLFETTQNNELLKEESQNICKKNKQYKQELKNLKTAIKCLEKQLSDERNKYNNSMQKIKERDSDIDIKKQHIQELEKQYRQVRDRNYQEIKQLTNQLNNKNTSSLSLNKQFNDKILKIQCQNKKLLEENVALKQQNENFSLQILKNNDMIEDLENQIKKLQQQKFQLQDEFDSNEFILNGRLEEIQKLEETIEEDRLNILNINNELETNQQQYNLSITKITHNYNSKIQILSRQYQQKLQLSHQQTEFAREKLQSLENQLNKALLEKKSQQIENYQAKKILEQKIKKVESQRLNSISCKNNQIKQLTEETTTQLSKLHEKEAQNRKISVEFEQLRLTTGRAQDFYSYSLEQSKQKEKLFQKQIQNWKTKQQQNINYKQKLLISLHQNEVETRKLLSTSIKRIIQVCSGDSEKLLTILKGLESNVISTMMTGLDSY